VARSIVLNDSEAIRKICGVNDQNIPYLENLFSSEIFLKGNYLEISSSDEGIEESFVLLIQKLNELSKEFDYLGETEIFMEFQALGIDGREELEDEVVEVPMLKVLGRTIFPKNNNQKRYLKNLLDKQIIFAIGPAGTGKTFLAISYALSQLQQGNFKKIILSRPVVEAGESLGFLPGDLSQKLNPYLKPLYDSMEYLMDCNSINHLRESNSIEVAPLAYMRGRSLNNCCIILDEAQNTTVDQMKMFLTRIGEDSKAIITGDVTQTDLKRGCMSGLVHARSILMGIKDIGFVDLTSKDVVRSRIVQRIVDAYEKN